MTRPPLEVADIVRCAGPSFVERNRNWINGQHEKVLSAITRCRTAALGGHRDQCSACGHTAISYNSCRNRHCPRCQGNARLRWLQARQRELLPTRYVHVVFTLPRELAAIALQNKRLIYDLLFQASAETLLEIARDPQHLGAEIGFFSVLHTWDQRLQHHPHVHCVVAAGGLASDHHRWICSRRSFFLPVKVLSRVFRGKFVAALKTAFAGNRIWKPERRRFATMPSDLRRLLTWLREQGVEEAVRANMFTPISWPTPLTTSRPEPPKSSGNSSARSRPPLPPNLIRTRSKACSRSRLRAKAFSSVLTCRPQRPYD
jgi:transposase-like zinc-binding protein/putative transposase